MGVLPKTNKNNIDEYVIYCEEEPYLRVSEKYAKEKPLIHCLAEASYNPYYYNRGKGPYVTHFSSWETKMTRPMKGDIDRFNNSWDDYIYAKQLANTPIKNIPNELNH